MKPVPPHRLLETLKAGRRKKKHVHVPVYSFIRIPLQFTTGILTKRFRYFFMI